MAKNFILEQLKQSFKGQESFSREALFRFFLRFEPTLNEGTFRWRIHNLKQKDLIHPLSRTEFTLINRHDFKPQIEDSEKKIHTLIEKGFKGLKQAIWSTRIINEFMLHQPVKSLTILEVEKEATESVFYFLKDSGVKNVFLQPSEKEIIQYVSDMDSPIIVQSLISKAPIQKVNKVSTVTLEKLLVDLFSDKKLFYAYQGKELSHIFDNAYHRYAIDFTRLFSYTRRRGKETDLKGFLSNKTDIPKTIVHD